MARRGARNNPESIIGITLNLGRGLDYSKGASAIDDNALWRLENFIYDAQTQFLKTRPGLACVTAEALDKPIRALYHYVKNSTTSYLIAVSSDKLYYLDDDTLTEIGSLSSATVIPSFATFNSLLIIADGNSDLRTWDGTTYTTIADSPQATALAVIKGHLVTNNTDDWDLVSMSAVNDATTWSGGSSVAIRCGYGDGMNVNGLAVAPGGNDLIVSKTGEAKKVMYRINVENATTSNWYAVPVSSYSAASSPNSIMATPNDVFFADSDGLKSVRGIQEYGDLATNYVGNRINSIFEGATTCDWMTWLPTYAALAFIVGDYTYLHFPFNDTFSKMYFMPGKMSSVFEGDSEVYFGGYDGYLWKLDPTLSVDYTDPDTTADFTSWFVTKRFTFMDAVLLRKAQIHLTPVAEGAGVLYAVTAEGTEPALKSVTLAQEGEFLYDADGDLYDATEDLYYAGNTPWFEKSHSKVRSEGIAFKFITTSGRAGINELKAEFALVRGN